MKRIIQVEEPADSFMAVFVSSLSVVEEEEDNGDNGKRSDRNVLPSSRKEVGRTGKPVDQVESYTAGQDPDGFADLDGCLSVQGFIVLIRNLDVVCLLMEIMESNLPGKEQEEEQNCRVG